MTAEVIRSAINGSIDDGVLFDVDIDAFVRGMEQLARHPASGPARESSGVTA